MTSSLRTRVAILCGIVALLTASLGLWSSSRILMEVIDTHLESHAQEAMTTMHQTEARLVAQLAYEVGDYAHWDDLYERMPLPSQEWARDNLSPGSFRGAVNRCMAIVAEGRLQACYATGGDDSPATALATWSATGLAKLADARAGMVLLGDRLLLQANEEILRSDRSGPPRGRLIAFRELDDDLIRQLAPAGWHLTLNPAQRGSPLAGPMVANESGLLTITNVLTVPGGDLRISLRALDDLNQTLRPPVIRGMIAAGLLGVLLATLLGMLLGWHWMDPLRRLAQACQRRAGGDAVALPDGRGLSESESLAQEVGRLIAQEGRARLELQATLERLRTAHAVHSRFSERLVADLEEPLRRLAALLDGARAGQALDAAALIEAQTALNRIGDRLADGAVLGQDSRAGRPGPTRIDLQAWIGSVAQAMRVQADKRQVRIETRCQPDHLHLDIRQVLPLLVHLLANALRAAPAASTVLLHAERHGDRLRFTIHDQGPGFPPDILARVKAACARGEVLPGEHGIGFGLSLVIERSVQLQGFLAIPASGAGGTTVELTIPCS